MCVQVTILWEACGIRTGLPQTGSELKLMEQVGSNIYLVITRPNCWREQYILPWRVTLALPLTHPTLSHIIHHSESSTSSQHSPHRPTRYHHDTSPCTAAFWWSWIHQDHLPQLAIVKWAWSEGQSCTPIWARCLIIIITIPGIDWVFNVYQTRPTH